MDVSIQQAEIKSWFDRTYKTKKFRYLRPQKAYDLFPTLLNVEKGSKHLDVACGLGLMMKAMVKHGVQSYGVDISTEAIKQAKAYCPEGSFTVGNAETLPYDDSSFDYITCIGSIERMLDRESVLKEQVRVGKEDARFCFFVRNSEHFLWRFVQKPLGFFNRKGHQDALNLREWITLFETCGLKVVDVERDHWHFYKMLSFIWSSVDTSKRKRLPFPLHWAYEFIFVLEKG